MFMPTKYYANNISIDSKYLTSKLESSFLMDFLSLEELKIALDQ